MRAYEVWLVQTSFAAIEPHAEAMASAFHEELFARDPSLRALFPAGPGEERANLMAALGNAVRALSRQPLRLPAFQVLGLRSAGIDAEGRHDALVRAALLAALERLLGDAFDADLRAAWGACYDRIAGPIQADARAVAA